MTRVSCNLQLRSASGPGVEVDIELEDEAHLAGAEAVFGVMYEVPGVLSSQDQPTLVSMISLALELDAPSAVEAIASELRKRAELTSEGAKAIVALQTLPRPLYPLLLKAVDVSLKEGDEEAKSAVQTVLASVFDDLDAVWTETDSSKRQMLCELSKDALILLLQSEQVKVVSEDTILHTICSNRHETVTSLLNPPPRKAKRAVIYQMQEDRAPLAAAVRIPYLTPTTLASIVPQLDWVTEHLSASQMVYAPLLGSTSILWDTVPVLSHFSGNLPDNWKAGPRPASAVQRATFTYEVDVNILAHDATAVAAAGTGMERTLTLQVQDHAMAFAGRSWSVAWRFKKGSNGVVQHVVAVQPTFWRVSRSQILWVPCFVLQCGNVAYRTTQRCHAAQCKEEGTEVIIGPMQNGWDWDVWAAMGFPRSGKVGVQLTLDVSSCR